MKTELEKGRRVRPITRAACVAVAAFICSAGCDRVKDAVERFTHRKGPPAKGAEVTDEQRIVAKFGQPAERLGIGTRIRTEHGIRYDRKWNYYYRAGGPGPTMRTVYFARGSFTGSVIRRPDGTWIREKVRFAY